MELYTYKASVLKVIDGDTVVLRVSLGFNVFVEEHFRLRAINTPELRSAIPEEKAKAQEAKAYLDGLLSGKTLLVKTEKDKQEKYGRYLCDIFIGETNINAEMIKAGYAKPYGVK